MDEELTNASAPIDILLVAMPWAALNRTPIQLGTLQQVLKRAGFSARSCSFYLSAMEHFASSTAALPPEERVTVNDYDAVAWRYWNVGMGDWIFAVPPYQDHSGEADSEYFQLLRARGVSEQVINKAALMRSHVPDFLESCAEEVLSASPRAVGFTSGFSQNVASLVLAKMLKERRPSLHVIFGGANCDGAMGPALHRAFGWVDTVVTGEAELVLPEIMLDVVSGRPLRPQPGICYRREGAHVMVEPSGATPVVMDDVPTPDYDEYFGRLEKSPLRSELNSRVTLVFEGARGCWWGEKMHCTFCGLNGSSMAFRSKSVKRVAEEVYNLAGKYRWLNFEAADNIIDMKYVRELLPELRAYRASGHDFRFFFETKANLSKKQLHLMREAGVLSIQPGIESLSTPILKLMKKGTTGLQNIRLLKWATQFEIEVEWNLLFGFPGEPPAEYERMADVMRSLTHLQPPTTTGAVVVERFSPYHKNPRAFGLTNVKPSPHYRFIYRVGESDLNDLAYDFTHEYDDGRDPESYTEEFRNGALAWERAYCEGDSLTYERGPGFLIIKDQRSGLGAHDYLLGPDEAKIYLGCDAGATPAALWKGLSEGGEPLFAPADIQTFLDELLKARLVYEEDGRYLSLAVPVSGSADNLVWALTSHLSAQLTKDSSRRALRDVGASLSADDGAPGPGAPQP